MSLIDERYHSLSNVSYRNNLNFAITCKYFAKFTIFDNFSKK